MTDQTLVQQVLDNFTLVYLFCAFVLICMVVILGSTKRSRDTAMSIFRNTDKPAAEPANAVQPREEARK